MGRLASLVLFLAALTVAAAADAAERVALVIGNGNYQGTAALPNPPRDAAAMADKLRSLGFEVILATDVDRRGAIAAIDRFTNEINGAQIALLYFAGHGIQIGGENFLLPTDVSVESERALRYSSIDIQEIVSEMERRAEVAIAILDACRDNPFVNLVDVGSRSTAVARGLGPMRLSGRGALIAYAAASGDVAADGAGDHSPFTAALLEEVGAPNVEVGLMFRRVARRVIDATNGEQRPELLVRLVDEVYLNPTAETTIVASDTAASTIAPPTPQPPGATVVADATRQASPPLANGDRFFGRRVIHTPPWVAGLTVSKPSGWRSVAPVAVAEDASNNTYGTAQPVPLAANVQATIAPRGDEDWYAVEVPSAGELRIDVDPVPLEIDLWARVWDANHAVVADWQGSPRAGGALAGRYPLPRPGKYWIEMTDGNSDSESTVPFTARIDFAAADDPFEPDNNPATATAVPATSDFTAAIYPRTDPDWYKVWIPAPGLLTVTATKVPETLDIAMRISNLDGQVVRDWQVPPRLGGDTVLQAELAEPGTYLIETGDANGDAASTDPFGLSVQFDPVGDQTEPNDIFGEATIVPPTSEHDLAIFPRGDADWLAFDIDHPGELKMSVTNAPKNLDISMRVWTADKQVLRDWFGPARPGGDVDDFADLPAPGRYFIEIRDGNDDQSSADLFHVALVFTPEPDQYEPNNGPATATDLKPGGQILFNILPRGDADWFRVEAASAGELAISIDEGPPNLDLNYRVWDESHQVVRDWVPPFRKGGLTEGFADLPRAGTYFIEVVDGNSDDRSILPATLTTAFTPVADTTEPNSSYGQAEPLELGKPIHANILPQGDEDWYLIEAPAAGTFKVTVDEVDPDLDIAVRLWNSEAAVAGDWVGPLRKGGVTEAEFKALAAGIYRLQVVDANGDAQSKTPYRLEVDFQ